MATINNKLIHFKSKSDFNSRYKETTDGGNTYGDFLGTSIVFIQDAKQIWTHGTEYHCGSGPVALQSDLSEYATTSALTSGLAGKANTLHAHTIANITNLQSTLDGKAAISHNHTSANITTLIGYTEGSSTTTLTPTMSLNTALASLQNQVQAKAASIHTHTSSQVSGLATVATSGSYNDLSNKPSIPEAYSLPTASASTLGGVKIGSGIDINSGTISINDDYIKLTDGQLKLNSSLNMGNSTIWFQSLHIAQDVGISFAPGGPSIDTNDNDIVCIDGAPILTEDNWSNYITTADTKNTAGTSNSTSKLYLAGGTSQSSTGVVTYSNSSVYTQSGQLYATQMNATNGFYETSDARLKNFYEDIKALEVVSEIPTKYFTWKKDEVDINMDPQLHIGTSAQEIQKIYPDLISEDGDGHLTVDYARLSIIALAAIKELKAELDELKANK